MKFKHGKKLRILDKKSVHIEDTVIMGDNVVIYENNRIQGETVIGDNVVIMSGCVINNCKIGNNVTINSSQTENSVIEDGCSVGPFARLRPNTYLNKNAKVGNFVEIKNAIIGEGTKINHLAYVGDADVGKNCNIGCGVIFVNYNGRGKSRSLIGDECFIGSNCNVIAPVKVEDRSYICAGTTVTNDTKTDDFVIGRVRQENKENRAHKYLKERIGE